jgi:CRP-like cAMP-binding protein
MANWLPAGDAWHSSNYHFSMVMTPTTPEVDHETVDAARLLSRAAVFSGVSASRLAELAPHTLTRHLEAGDFLFREGETGTSMYVLGEGRIRLYLTGPDGSESTLALLDAPDSFGELAVFDGGPRSASAVAVTPSKVVSLSGAAMRKAYRSDPDLADSLLRSLAGLVRQATDQRSLLVFHDLAARVARYLIDETDGRGNDVSYVVAHISDLASSAGGSEADLRRILHVFERDGLIRQQGVGLVVLARNELSMRASATC